MKLRKDKPGQFAAVFDGYHRAYNCPPCEILEVREDRILFRGVWGPWLNRHCEPWNAMISEHEPYGRKTAVVGWRDRYPFCSAQFILHQDPKLGSYYEMDFDLGNPNGGLLPLIRHGFEYLWYRIRKSKTNPYQVARLLRRRGLEVERV